MGRLLLAAVIFFAMACLGASIPPMTPAPAQTPSLSPEITVTPSPYPTVTPSAAPTPATTPLPAAQRVLIISIDGLRGDALANSNAPRIRDLLQKGQGTFSAQTVYPGNTLPAHTSMLTGLCIPDHGITWNDLQSDVYVQADTVFSLGKAAGLRTVMVVGKSKLVTIARPGTVDEFQFVAGSDEQTAEAAVARFADGFGVLFVHLPVVDGVGHDDGWMSAQYFQVIKRADTAVGILMVGLEAAGLREGTLVILTSDHGGHAYGHGTNLPEDMNIPWIIAGPGVVELMPLKIPVSVTDTAATALWALGLPVPPEWTGRPVVEAFGLTADETGVKGASENRCGKET